MYIQSKTTNLCQFLRKCLTIDVIFISPEGGTPDWDDAPRQMADWQNLDPDGQVRWDSFVEHFKLKNLDGLYADYAKKSIYFLPTCDPQEPAGLTGGENFNILAKIPVLVD